MKYKNIIKTILVIVLIIIWLIVADYVLNKTHTEISLPLGMILLNLPIFIIGICLIIYFKKKLNKKKNVTIGDNLCMAFICLIVSFYFIIKVFPFFLDAFGKIEEVNLINAEIYTLRNFEMHGPDYQYFISLAHFLLFPDFGVKISFPWAFSIRRMHQVLFRKRHWVILG